MNILAQEIWLAGLFDCTVVGGYPGHWDIMDGKDIVGTIDDIASFNRPSVYHIDMKCEGVHIRYVREGIRGGKSILNFDNGTRMELSYMGSTISIRIESDTEALSLECSSRGAEKFRIIDEENDREVLLEDTSIEKNYTIYDNGDTIYAISDKDNGGIIITDKDGNKSHDDKTLEEYMIQEYENDNSVAKSLLDSIEGMLKELPLKKKTLREILGDELVDESGLGILLPKEDEKKKDDKKGARRKKLGEKS